MTRSAGVLSQMKRTSTATKATEDTAASTKKARPVAAPVVSPPPPFNTREGALDHLRVAAIWLSVGPDQRARDASEIVAALVAALEGGSDDDLAKPRQWARGRVTGARTTRPYHLPGKRADVVRSFLAFVELELSRYGFTKMATLSAISLSHHAEALGIERRSPFDLEAVLRPVCEDLAERGVKDPQIVAKRMIKACGVSEDGARNMIENTMPRVKRTPKQGR